MTWFIVTYFAIDILIATGLSVMTHLELTEKISMDRWNKMFFRKLDGRPPEFNFMALPESRYWCIWLNFGFQIFRITYHIIQMQRQKKMKAKWEK